MHHWAPPPLGPATFESRAQESPHTEHSIEARYLLSVPPVIVPEVVQAVRFFPPCVHSEQHNRRTPEQHGEKAL